MTVLYALVIGTCAGGEPMQGDTRACWDWQERGRYETLAACVAARRAMQEQIARLTRGPILCRRAHATVTGKPHD